jgi:hypothetical protein
VTAPRGGASGAGDDAAGQQSVAAGLLAKLIAAVRPEFRGEVLMFGQGDPVFGGQVCRVTSCARMVQSRSLCRGHVQRWNALGRPDLEEFAATTSAVWKGQQYSPCAVQGCRYGRRHQVLCSRHFGAWKKWAGKESLSSPPCKNRSFRLVDVGQYVGLMRLG